MPLCHLESQGTATKAASPRLSPSHTGVTQGQAAGSRRERCRPDFSGCPKGCWKQKARREKPVSSHFLGLYPKGRVPGQLLGTPQLSRSQLEGSVGEGGREGKEGREGGRRREGGRDEGWGEGVMK